MQFRAEEYYQASLERMRQALALQRDSGSSSLAMYCGGLAVECLLRAFRWTKDASFERRHDLAELFKASEMEAVDTEYLRRRGAPGEAIETSGLRMREAIRLVILLWDNNLRFASEASLRAHLKRLGRLHGKGDPLKRNARELLTAAQELIQRGTILWASRKKSRGH